MATTDDLNYNGLQTKDYNTLLTELTTAIQEIYTQNGEQIDVGSNTPDGQLINILAELGTIVREILTEVYNSIDPSKCVGSVQDSRYQINYLTRKSGAFTLQPITIITDRTVELRGLDAEFDNVEASAYAIADNNGNTWYLVDTTICEAGSTVAEFRAKEKGAVIPTIGTITNPVTIVDGVVSVINSVGVSSVGTEEESDSDFMLRREQSVSNSSKNNVDVIQGKIAELDGVVAVKIHINDTDITDDTGTLPHFIWVIVEGGSSNDIGNIIYANKGGCGTRGDVIVPITTASLQVLNIKFDRPSIVPLYIKFDIKPIEDIAEINQSSIKEYVAENLTYTIGENAETSKITDVCASAMLSDGGNGYALNVLISSGGQATATPDTASVDVTVFQGKMGNIATGDYVITYKNGEWTYEGNTITLADYGIVSTAEPQEDDTITINYTEGT